MSKKYTNKEREKVKGRYIEKDKETKRDRNRGKDSYRERKGEWKRMKEINMVR